MLDSITDAMRISIVDQVIVISNEPVPPWSFLISRGALEVAGESFRGALSREGLSILDADHGWIIEYFIKNSGQ